VDVGIRNAYKISLGKSECKTLFGKIILKLMLQKYHVRIFTALTAQDRIWWWVLVNVVTGLWILWKVSSVVIK
jgi:hypothetical protein